MATVETLSANDVIAAALKKAKLDVSQKDAKAVIDAVTDQIVASVKKGSKVRLYGFGTFELKKRAARKGRNPQTGEVVKIKASKSIGFKPSSQAKGKL